MTSLLYHLVALALVAATSRSGPLDAQNVARREILGHVGDWAVPDSVEPPNPPPHVTILAHLLLESTEADSVPLPERIVQLAQAVKRDPREARRLFQGVPEEAAQGLYTRLMTHPNLTAQQKLAALNVLVQDVSAATFAPCVPMNGFAVADSVDEFCSVPIQFVAGLPELPVLGELKVPSEITEFVRDLVREGRLDRVNWIRSS